MKPYFFLGLAFGVAIFGMPQSLPAQAGEIVEGRVYEAHTDLGIQNAVVELEGYGSTLTDTDGGFRFEDVPAGGYTLRVLAFGYAPESQFIVVTGPTDLEIPLEVAALPLDSVVVDMRRIDIEGRVRDPVEDFYLVGANVLTNQGTQTETDAHGRFRVEVFEEAPLHVSVRAFGYLPLDTVVTPEEDGRYVLDLQADSLIERMVAVQVERLERRAAPRFAVGFRNLNRDRLLRYAGSHTLFDVLLWEYGERRLDRVSCVLIDEVPYVAGAAVQSDVIHMLPEEVERIEFMFRGAMLRIYTREFMQQMIARDVELRRPSMFGGICR